MVAEQAVIAGNSISVMTGYSCNAAHGDLLRGMFADELGLSPFKTRVIEGSILRFDEIGPAIMAKILLISRRILPVFHDVFPFFDEVEPAFRILTGYCNGAAGTRHIP